VKNTGCEVHHYAIFSLAYFVKFYSCRFISCAVVVTSTIRWLYACILPQRFGFSPYEQTGTQVSSAPQLPFSNYRSVHERDRPHRLALYHTVQLPGSPLTQHFTEHSCGVKYIFRKWDAELNRYSQSTINEAYEGVSKSFRTESITIYTPIFGITRCEAIQRVMAAKFTRLTHKIVIQLHLMAESYIICSSRTRRPVRKLLDTPPYPYDTTPLRVLGLRIEDTPSRYGG
jgi:hypothetical protein